MVVRPASKRPVIFSARVGDRQIIDTRDSASHQPVLVELVAAVVMTLVSETHRYPVPPKTHSSFDQPIVQLLMAVRSFCEPTQFL